MSDGHPLAEMVPMFSLGDEMYDAPLLPEFECAHGGWTVTCLVCMELAREAVA